jgi:predicted enzyme related to lactoylglutathione lyase
MDTSNCSIVLKRLVPEIMVSSQNIPTHTPRMDTIIHIKSANTILYCKKWEETVAFYRSGLKLPVTTGNEWFVEFKLTRTSRLSVADESRKSIKSSGGTGITIGLQVADITAARTQLEEAGLNPTQVREIWGSKVIYVFDPEGNRIEFWSGRAKS